MKAPANIKESLNKEYAAYRKVYRVIFWLYYVSVGILFIFLCRQVVDSQSFIPASLFVLFKELCAIAGIWYLFHLCETNGGLLKLLREWEKSLIYRVRQEEALDVLREGGIYFVDDREMVLVDDKYLVPRDQLK